MPVQMAEKHPFAFCLTLICGLNGFDLCARLKQTDEFDRPYVIIITALEEPGLEEKVKSLGADLFFQKPLHLKDVADSMKSFFESLSEN